MPIYEFLCRRCANGKFELLKGYGHGATAICPACGAVAERVLSPCNWSFGWRISDRSMHVPGTPKDELVRDM